MVIKVKYPLNFESFLPSGGHEIEISLIMIESKPSLPVVEGAACLYTSGCDLGACEDSWRALGVVAA